jgi:CheY-like chemotaxis protein
MDVSMPIMDGMTSTRAIRQHEVSNDLARCRIVALTGLASATARLEALSSGVDTFMTKPLNFKALGSLLRKEEERKTQDDDARNKRAKRRGSTTSQQLAETTADPQTTAGIETQTDTTSKKADAQHTTQEVDLQQVGNTGTHQDALELKSHRNMGSETHPLVQEGERSHNAEERSQQRDIHRDDASRATEGSNLPQVAEGDVKRPQGELDGQ